MKRILIGIVTILCIFAFGCSSKAPLHGDFDYSSNQPSSSTINGINYTDVSNLIEDALADMGVTEKSDVVGMKLNNNDAGISSAQYTMKVEDRNIEANCVYIDGKWHLSYICGGQGDSLKFYWLADGTQKSQDLYDFKSDKLIYKKSE